MRELESVDIFCEQAIIDCCKNTSSDAAVVVPVVFGIVALLCCVIMCGIMIHFAFTGLNK